MATMRRGRAARVPHLCGVLVAAVAVVAPRDMWDPQRRLVFPLILEFAQEAFAEVAP